MLLVVDIVKGMQTQTAECLVIGEITCEKMIVVLNKLDLIPPDKQPSTLDKVRLKQPTILDNVILKQPAMLDKLRMKQPTTRDKVRLKQPATLDKVRVKQPALLNNVGIETIVILFKCCCAKQARSHYTMFVYRSYIKMYFFMLYSEYISK